MSIYGGCIDCGFVWDMYNLPECPACRIARVSKAFKPVDTLRTTLGIPGSFKVNRYGDIVGLDYVGDAEDTPVDLRIPRDDSAQIYQLKRLFRL